MKNALIYFLAFLLSSCHADTGFFHLTHEDSNRDNDIRKHIVIANPPEKLDALYSAISDYVNKDGYLFNTAEQSISIYFYKETGFTPRDFESNDDDCNFDSKNIGCHTDDIIGVLEKDGNETKIWVLKLRKNLDSSWVVYPIILR